MCGINGYRKLPGMTAPDLGVMQANCHQRGPDAKHHYQDSSVVLGHNLLAIQAKPEDSLQPYTTTNSDWVLLLDGEIYEFQRLRSLLGSKTPPSTSDTAHLFALIEKYGWDFIQHVHGVFAIVLYHKKSGELRLYRDPSGQKHLYYSHAQGGFIFSSLLKNIIQYPGADWSVDSTALGVASLHGYVPGPQTLVTGVRRVLPGQVVTSKRSGSELGFDFLPQPPKLYDNQSILSATEALIKEHAQGTTPLLVNLSGGLDSTFLAYTMHRLGIPMTAFTTRFVDAPDHFNEDANLAMRFASDLGIPLTVLDLTANDFTRVYEKSYAVVEEPVCSHSLPLYYLMAEQQAQCGNGARIVLTGEGGDEVFGGYPHYRYDTDNPSLLKNNYWHWPTLYLNYYPAYMRHNFLSTPFAKETMYEYIQSFVDPYLRQYLSVYTPDSVSMTIDQIVWLAGQTFVRQDKTYLHHNLESRSPFAYQPYRQHLRRILTDRDYFDATGNKAWLRQTLQDHLPAYIVANKKKRGWKSPAAAWWNSTLHGYYEDQFTTALQNSSGMIDWRRALTELKRSQQLPGLELQTIYSLAVTANTLGLRV